MGAKLSYSFISNESLLISLMKSTPKISSAQNFQVRMQHHYNTQKNNCDKTVARKHRPNWSWSHFARCECRPPSRRSPSPCTNTNAPSWQLAVYLRTQNAGESPIQFTDIVHLFARKHTNQQRPELYNTKKHRVSTNQNICQNQNIFVFVCAHHRSKSSNYLCHS